jgi:1,4-alpha-glucan branching enzyme
MEKGYLALVLHAHLPFVRHPEYEDFLEEHWLFEAITETYIPLINVFDRLLEENIDFAITMSITPTLASMLTDDHLQQKYLKHLNKLIELAEKEIIRTRWQPDFHNLALMYRHRFINARSVFADKYKMNLINAFRKFQDAGKLEVITCAGTHAYLPLAVHKQAVRAQIKVGADLYQKLFGIRPRGIWLPECGYNPGDDEILKEAGIKYFLTDTHGILFGSPRPKYGVYAPCYCKSGVAAFGRDLESSKSVWSAEEGYPGDYNYREFYRDVGYDLDFDYIRPYINPDGTRINTGVKYYRITGRTNDKQPYVPAWATEKAAGHAGNFLFNREKQLEHLCGIMHPRKPIIISPYDAELYGHWWFEGPQWLDFLIRKIAFDQKTVKLITPSKYLEIYPKNQVLAPSMSSWGWKGYSEVWLEGSNDWIYRHLHKAAEHMIELANENNHKEVDGLKRRALNQMARELMLAQSSDWAFILKTGTFVPYVYRRMREHIYRTSRLYEEIKNNRIQENWLKYIEDKDNLFPDIDYRIYAD